MARQRFYRTVLVYIVTVLSVVAAAEVETREKTLASGGQVRLACPKATDRYYQFSGEYYWAHIPRQSRTPIQDQRQFEVADTSDSSAMSSGSSSPSHDGSVCDVSIYKRPGTTARMYRQHEANLQDRIIVSGRLVIGYDDSDDPITDQTFPGRTLWIQKLSRDDEGLWVCCTNTTHGRPVRAYSISVTSPSKNPGQARGSITVLKNHSTGRVLHREQLELASTDCPDRKAVRDQASCKYASPYHHVCNCRVQCVLPCLSSRDQELSHYFTWSFDLPSQGVQSRRLEAVARNYLGELEEPMPFRAEGSTLFIATSYRLDYRRDFDGWRNFAQGRLNVTCHAVNLITGQSQSTQLDITRLARLQTEERLRSQKKGCNPTEPPPTPTTPATIYSYRPERLLSDTLSLAVQTNSGSRRALVAGLSAALSVLLLCAVLVVVAIARQRMLRRQALRDGRLGRGRSTRFLSVFGCLGSKGYQLPSDPACKAAGSDHVKSLPEWDSNQGMMDVSTTGPVMYGRRYTPDPDPCPHPNQFPGSYLHVLPTYSYDSSAIGALQHRTSSEEAHKTIQSWSRRAQPANHDYLTEINESSAWCADRSKLTIGQRIGEGEFGQVFKGVLHDGQFAREDVAIKMPLDKCFDNADTTADMMLEITTMVRVLKGHQHSRNPFLVNLLGFCIDPYGPPLIVLEYCSKGSLLDWLRSFRSAPASTSHPYANERPRNWWNGNSHLNETEEENGRDLETASLATVTTPCEATKDDMVASLRDSSDHLRPADSTSWSEHAGDDVTSTCTDDGQFCLPSWVMVRFAHQIASGMEGLANVNVVHRDLAARNVVITSKNVLKVADFGLARSVSGAKGYYRMQNSKALPLFWMAPEVFPCNADVKFNEATDVWSFGVVLWEICTLGQMPYGKNIPVGDLFNQLKAGRRLTNPGNCPPLSTCMDSCWAGNPTERPSFKTLRAYFEQKLETRKGWPYLPFDCHKSTNTLDLSPLPLE